MLTSARRGLSYPNNITRTDTADVPRDIATVIAALELDVVFGSGTHASRPAAGAGAPAGTGGGRLWWETDTLHLFYDTGSAWVDITPSTAIADGSVTLAKLAANSVDASKIVDASIGAAELATAAVTAAKIAAALFPSQGAANGTEAFRAIGNAAGQVAAGNDPRFRTEVGGRVNADASVAAGTGWTATTNGTGQYVVTYNTPFASIPVVLLSGVNGAINLSTSTTTGFTAQTVSGSGNAFSFISTLPF